MLLLLNVKGYSQQSSSSNDSIPLGTITADFDGITVTYLNCIATKQPTKGCDISGYKYSEDSSIDTPLHVIIVNQHYKGLVVGTYSDKSDKYGRFSQAGIVYDIPPVETKEGKDYPFAYGAQTCTVTITSLTDKTIQGTFSGVLKSNYKHKKKRIIITNGKFNLAIRNWM